MDVSSNPPPLHPSHKLTTNKKRNSIAEIASGIVCGCLITMPHFFRHFAPKIASKLSLSRSRGSGPSKLASFLPVRATVRAKNPPEWSAAAYDSASRGAKDDYMELGESNTWRGGPPPRSSVSMMMMLAMGLRAVAGTSGVLGALSPISRVMSRRFTRSITRVLSDDAWAGFIADGLGREVGS